jgi:hypothetical protein
MDAPDHPRRLLRQWIALLLAPVAWSAALGILFPLTEDACARGSRTAFWVVLLICVGGHARWRVAGLAGEGGHRR